MSHKPEDDPLLALIGADEHADEYVRRIREGWDEAAELRENPPRSTDASSDGSPK